LAARDMNVKVDAGAEQTLCLDGAVAYSSTFGEFKPGEPKPVGTTASPGSPMPSLPPGKLIIEHRPHKDMSRTPPCERSVKIKAAADVPVTRYVADYDVTDLFFSKSAKLTIEVEEPVRLDVDDPKIACINAGTSRTVDLDPGHSLKDPAIVF